MKTKIILAILLATNSAAFASRGDIFAPLVRAIEPSIRPNEMVEAIKRTRLYTQGAVDRNVRKLEATGKPVDDLPMDFPFERVETISKIMVVDTPKGRYTVGIGTRADGRLDKKFISTLEIDGNLSDAERKDIFNIFADDIDQILRGSSGIDHHTIIIPIDTNDMTGFRLKVTQLVSKISNETLGKNVPDIVRSRSSIRHSER